MSGTQELSEETIEKNKDRINWDMISAFQKLSPEFISKHKDQLNLRYVLYFQKELPKELEKLRTPITEFKRSYRMRAVCAILGIKTIGDIANITVKDLKKIDICMPHIIYEFKRLAKQHGITITEH